MTWRLSRRDTMLLAAVVAVAAAAAMWWFYVAPARSDAGQRDAELAVVVREANGLSDTLGRLRAARPGATARTAERLRLAKALPVDDQVPGAVVQLQDLATRAGVELTSIAAVGTAAHGSLNGAEFQLAVAGRFHDVDDFLYRLHNQVAVDARQRPVIRGRLFALRTVAIQPDDGSGARDGRLRAGTGVVANLVVVAYTAPTDDGAPVEAGGAEASVPSAADEEATG